jgi:hypothetical protein
MSKKHGKKKTIEKHIYIVYDYYFRIEEMKITGIYIFYFENIHFTTLYGMYLFYLSVSLFFFIVS